MSRRGTSTPRSGSLCASSYGPPVEPPGQVQVDASAADAFGPADPEDLLHPATIEGAVPHHRVAPPHRSLEQPPVDVVKPIASPHRLALRFRSLIPARFRSSVM